MFMTVHEKETYINFFKDKNATKLKFDMKAEYDIKKVVTFVLFFKL